MMFSFKIFSDKSKGSRLQRQVNYFTSVYLKGSNATEQKLCAYMYTFCYVKFMDLMF